MRLSDIYEAGYYNTNAANWAQGAIDLEHDVYYAEAQQSWPKVLQIVGTQSYRFDHDKAMNELTNAFGESNGLEDGYMWYVAPTDADINDPDYFELEVVLLHDGVVVIGDIVQ